jgi:hypothetical protein
MKNTINAQTSLSQDFLRGVDSMGYFKWKIFSVQSTAGSANLLSDKFF